VAAQHALEMAGVAAQDIDAVVVGTITGDMQFPATAVFVQDRIGATNAVAFDLSAACSGFIYGVNVAHGLIVSGQAKRALVVGAEVLSKFLDHQDRATCVLFGDGAGAAVMEGCGEGEGILATHMGTDGSLADLLCIPAGGSRIPLAPGSFDERGHYIKMKGDGVFKWAVRAMADAARRVIADAGITQDEVALMVPHQANMRIIDAVVDRLQFDKSRVFINLDQYGNTSAATIPTAFDEAVRGGLIKPGDYVVFAGFGGGFTWGATLFRHAIG
jgi:3-oxoacyl-[acyl-carrier-protein] synthase-3